MKKQDLLHTIVDLTLWINEELSGCSIRVVVPSVGTGYDVFLTHRGKTIQHLERSVPEAYLVGWLNGYLSALTGKPRTRKFASPKR